jgi:hypothetical protein
VTWNKRHHKSCHPEQSERSAFAFAVALLSVIPAGNLLLPSIAPQNIIILREDKR